MSICKQREHPLTDINETVALIKGKRSTTSGNAGRLQEASRAEVGSGKLEIRFESETELAELVEALERVTQLIEN